MMIVVMGSGIGSLVTACRFVVKKEEVTIFEKNESYVEILGQ